MQSGGGIPARSDPKKRILERISTPNDNSFHSISQMPSNITATSNDGNHKRFRHNSEMNGLTTSTTSPFEPISIHNNQNGSNQPSTIAPTSLALHPSNSHNIRTDKGSASFQSMIYASGLHHQFNSHAIVPSPSTPRENDQSHTVPPISFEKPATMWQPTNQSSLRENYTGHGDKQSNLHSLITRDTTHISQPRIGVSPVNNSVFNSFMNSTYSNLSYESRPPSQNSIYHHGHAAHPHTAASPIPRPQYGQYGQHHMPVVGGNQIQPSTQKDPYQSMHIRHNSKEGAAYSAYHNNPYRAHSGNGNHGGGGGHGGDSSQNNHRRSSSSNSMIITQHHEYSAYHGKDLMGVPPKMGSTPYQTTLNYNSTLDKSRLPPQTPTPTMGLLAPIFPNTTTPPIQDEQVQPLPQQQQQLATINTQRGDVDNQTSRQFGHTSDESAAYKQHFRPFANVKPRYPGMLQPIKDSLNAAMARQQSGVPTRHPGKVIAPGQVHTNQQARTNNESKPEQPVILSRNTIASHAGGVQQRRESTRQRLLREAQSQPQIPQPSSNQEQRIDDTQDDPNEIAMMLSKVDDLERFPSGYRVYIFEVLRRKFMLSQLTVFSKELYCTSCGSPLGYYPHNWGTGNICTNKLCNGCSTRRHQKKQNVLVCSKCYHIAKSTSDQLSSAKCDICRVGTLVSQDESQIQSVSAQDWSAYTNNDADTCVIAGALPIGLLPKYHHHLQEMVKNYITQQLETLQQQHTEYIEEKRVAFESEQKKLITDIVEIRARKTLIGDIMTSPSLHRNFCVSCGQLNDPEQKIYLTMWNTQQGPGAPPKGSAVRPQKRPTGKRKGGDNKPVDQSDQQQQLVASESAIPSSSSPVTGEDDNDMEIHDIMKICKRCYSHRSRFNCWCTQCNFIPNRLDQIYDENVLTMLPQRLESDQYNDNDRKIVNVYHAVTSGMAKHCVVCLVGTYTSGYKVKQQQKLRLRSDINQLTFNELLFPPSSMGMSPLLSSSSSSTTTTTSSSSIHEAQENLADIAPPVSLLNFFVSLLQPFTNYQLWKFLTRDTVLAMTPSTGQHDLGVMDPITNGAGLSRQIIHPNAMLSEYRSDHQFDHLNNPMITIYNIDINDEYAVRQYKLYNYYQLTASISPNPLFYPIIPFQQVVLIHDIPSHHDIIKKPIKKYDDPVIGKLGTIIRPPYAYHIVPRLLTCHQNPSGIITEHDMALPLPFQDSLLIDIGGGGSENHHYHHDYNIENHQINTNPNLIRNTPDYTATLQVKTPSPSTTITIDTTSHEHSTDRPPPHSHGHGSGPNQQQDRVTVDNGVVTVYSFRGVIPPELISYFDSTTQNQIRTFIDENRSEYLTLLMAKPTSSNISSARLGRRKRQR